MRKYLLLATAAAMIATPAVARDGSGYVGLEGGFLMDADLEVDVDGTDGVDEFEFDDAFKMDFGVGTDLDLIAGYDFGMFRAEAELAYKRTKLQGVKFDEDLVED